MWLPKGFNAQHCLLVMIEKFKEAIDKGYEFCVLLTDLSKAFDCINHPLLIAKLTIMEYHLCLLIWCFPI